MGLWGWRVVLVIIIIIIVVVVATSGLRWIIRVIAIVVVGKRCTRGRQRE